MSPAERKEEMEKEHFHPTPRGNFPPYVWLEWRGEWGREERSTVEVKEEGGRTFSSPPLFIRRDELSIRPPSLSPPFSSLKKLPSLLFPILSLLARQKF